MAVSANPVFKFCRDAYVVKVENVAQSVNRQEIVQLFAGLIGEVRKCNEYQGEGGRRFLELTFASQDASKKAICMNGYTVAGAPLVVTAALPSGPQRTVRQSKQHDARRNLYVLGLPFDLTKSEFVEIFSRYGTVSHAVILATVDNASRRRGFIVMGSHNDARLAMDALSRKEIKGHTIDVSWAVVQRSQGFLDGGDRTMVLSNVPASPRVPPNSGFDLSEAPPFSAQARIIATPQIEETVSTVPLLSCSMSTLLVTNLPAALFSQVSDLDPLFCPFGDIKLLKVLDKHTDANNISVIIEYKSAVQAREACDMLNGQVYANQPVKAEFLQPRVTMPQGTALGGWLSSQSDIRGGLNPHAAPFAIHTFMAPPLRPAGPSYDCVRNDDVTLPNDGNSAASAYSRSSAGQYPSSTYLYPPGPGFVRPNSAPSCWPHENYAIYPERWTCSAQNLSSCSPQLHSTSTA